MRMPKRLLAFTLDVLLVLSVFSILALSVWQIKPTYATAEWLTGWNYRKSHVINNAAGAGTLYQIPIIIINASNTDSGNTVYINNKTKTDFGDIRFTDNDGTTILDYWMETLNIGVNATFWVEVADTLESAPQTIYVYYGKADTATTSNGEITFKLFDDFSFKKWGTTTFNPAEWGSIVKVSSTYYIFYHNGTDNDIYRGSSSDLITWTTDAKVLNETNNPEILKELDGSTPVIYDGKYWMLISYSTFALYSAPTITGDWTINSSNILTTGGAGTWDQNNIGTCSFFEEDNTYYIYYQGQNATDSVWRIGYATAATPSGTWTKSGTNPRMAPTYAWEGTLTEDPVMRKWGGIYYLFYTGNVYAASQNSYATSSSLDGPWVKSGINITYTGMSYPEIILHTDGYYYIHGDNQLSTNKVVLQSTNFNFSTWTSTGTPTLAGGVLTVQNNGIKSVDTFGMNNRLIFQANISSPIGGGTFTGFGLHGWDTGFDNNAPFEDFVQQDGTGHLWTLSGSTVYTDLSITYLNSYHQYAIGRGSTTEQFFVGNSLVKSESSPSTASLLAVLYSQNTKEKIDVDYVFVTKYVYPEPTHGTWGSEEGGLPPSEGVSRAEYRGVFGFEGLLSYSPDWDTIASTLASYNITGFFFNDQGGMGRRPDATISEIVNATHSYGLEYHSVIAVLCDTKWTNSDFCAITSDGNIWSEYVICPIKGHDFILDNLEEYLSLHPTIDGLMLDFIRYDSVDMCYCPQCKAAFETWLGEGTITDWTEFYPDAVRWLDYVEWRNIPVTTLVGDIRSLALSINSSIKISEAAWTFFDDCPIYWRKYIGQDTGNWIKQGYLDFVAPMMYSSTLSEVENEIVTNQKYMQGGQEGKIPLLGFYDCSRGATVDEIVAIIEKGRDYKMDGWILWRYGGPGLTDCPYPDITNYLGNLTLPEIFSIENLTVTPSSNSATITWDTDLSSSSKVEYNTSNLFTSVWSEWGDMHYWWNQYVGGTWQINNTVDTHHAVVITGLVSDTTYYYRAQSENSGNVTSLGFTFITTTVTITYPANTTYTTSTISVQISASGGTIDKIWYNCKNGSSWIYGSNQTYTVPTTMTGFVNGTSYRFYGWANNTVGDLGQSTVMFTVTLYVVEVTLSSPTNSTYTSSNVTVTFSAVGGTIDKKWYNCKNASSWIYTSNLTYTATVNMTGFINGTSYTFYGYANNTLGDEGVSSVMFSVGIYVVPPTDLSYIAVSLNAPVDGYSTTSTVITFTYTPYTTSTFENASLYLNITGTWQSVGLNTTAILNNTVNSWTYMFLTYDTFSWNIQVYNTTDYAFANLNYTLTLTAPTVTPPTGNVFYFCPDTQTINTVTGYKLSETQPNSNASASISASGNVTGYVAYRVFIVYDDGTMFELSSGYIAITGRTNDTEGLTNATWACPRTSLNVGFQALRVEMYMQIGSGGWIDKATFISGFLNETEITASTWIFQTYTKHAYTGGSTIMTATWGTSIANTLLDNVGVTDPGIYDLLIYQLNMGNFIGFIFMPYTNLVGNLFYGLLLLVFFVPLYNRYKSFSPIIILLILFGGAGGILSLMVPEAGLGISWIFLVVGIGGLIYKVFR